MNNKRTDFDKRPTPNVGNNNHNQRITKIKEFLSSCENKEADFQSIWLYVNANTRHGVISYALSNILAKRKEFEKVGKEIARNPVTDNWSYTTIWRLVE